MLSETWLQYVQIPGCNFCYRNQDERHGGSVGLYIKYTVKYKERQDLSKLDESFEHVWRENRGTNKIKIYRVCVFYEPTPEEKEKIKWIQKLDAILSIVTTWNKNIIVCGDTNIDHKK